jgi:hypothetical protein
MYETIWLGDLRKNRNCQFLYKLAGRYLASDFELVGLDKFLDEGDEESTLAREALIEVEPRLVMLNEANAQSRFYGDIVLNGKEQLMQCWSADDLLQIDIAGNPLCQIDSKSNSICFLDIVDASKPDTLEIAIGAALISLCAREDLFFLHASAAKTPFGVALFMAESGVGKSTLARHVDDNWHQLADDIVPLSVFNNQVRLHTDYPQLKLADNSIENYSDYNNAKVDVIFQLQREPTEEIIFEELDGVEGMLAVIRHSVSTRLFDEDLLQTHMAFASLVTNKVPVIKLSYPRNLQQLEDLQDAITVFIDSRISIDAAKEIAR